METQRRKKFKSNRMCCVYNCTNRCETNTVSLHGFPKIPNLRKKWEHALRMGKVLPRNAVVCSDHFKEDDFRIQCPPVLRRRLRLDAIPSRNLPLSSVPSQMLGKAKSRQRQTRRRENSWLVEEKENDSGEGSVSSVTSGEPAQALAVEVVPDHSRRTSIENEVAHALLELSNGKESVSKCVQVDTLNFLPMHSLLNLIKKDEDLNAFTGLPKFSGLRQLAEACNEVHRALGLWRYVAHSMEERIVLTLIKFKLNISFKAIAILMNVSPKTAKNYFLDTVDVLSAVLSEFILWPSREDIKQSFPKCFRGFEGTRCIVDCTETPLEIPSCLSCKIKTYSRYKGAITLKYMLGVAPDGMITFCSRAYGGKCSDKFIFNDCGILNLFEEGDAIMCDKGFMIEEECRSRGIRLIRPPFVGRKKQLSVKEGIMNSEVARARVHVERAIQRLKIFTIFNSRMPWTLLSKVNEMLVIACGVVNLSSPILSAERF